MGGDKTLALSIDEITRLVLTGERVSWCLETAI